MKKKKYINIFKKEDGAGLVLALMVLMVLAVLGVAVAGVTIGSHKLGDISRDSNSAYYIAEAGANLAYKEIENAIMDQYNNSSDENIYFGNISSLIASVNGKEYVDKFDPQFGDQPKATIKISEAESVSDGEEYTIISTGEIAGKARTVKKPFIIKWKRTGGIGLPELPEGCVLYASGDIDFGNNAKVSGDIIRDSGFNLINYGEINHTYEESPGVYSVENLNMQPFYDLKNAFPDLPVNYKSYNSSWSGNKVSGNSYINEMKITSPLIIDTQGKTMNLVVDNLSVGANINISGGGTVNLYVTNKMVFTNNVKFNANPSSDVEQLNILYSGTVPVDFNNNMDFNGSLFFEQANLVFSNNVTIRGIIITFGSKLTINNNVQVTASIYAPRFENPKSEVIMNQNAKLIGTLVAHKMTLQNNSVATYFLNPYLEDYPFGTGEGGAGQIGRETVLDDLISAGPALEP